MTLPKETPFSAKGTSSPKHCDCHTGFSNGFMLLYHYIYRMSFMNKRNIARKSGKENLLSVL